MLYDNGTFQLSDEHRIGSDYGSGNSLNTESAPASRQIVILTSESIVAQKQLEGIFPYLAENNIKPVVILTPNSKSPRAAIPSLQHYGFYEEGIFKEVIFPELDARSRRSGLAPTFNELVRANDCEVHKIKSLKDDCVMKAVQAPSTIGALSIYHDAIFKADLITAVKDKGFFWNVHPAVLPDNRGLYLAFWNKVNGVDSHGCTLHEIDEGIDTGGVISTYEIPLDPSKSVVESYFQIPQGGATLVCDALDKYLRKGKVDAVPHAPGENTSYFTFPREVDIASAWEQNVHMVATPQRMVEVYTGMYGNDPILRNKIIDAIAEVEGIDATLLRTKTPKVDTRRSTLIDSIFGPQQALA